MEKTMRNTIIYKAVQAVLCLVGFIAFCALAGETPWEMGFGAVVALRLAFALVVLLCCLAGKACRAWYAHALRVARAERRGE